MNIVGYKSPFKKKASPTKFLTAATAYFAANPAMAQIGLAAAPGLIGAIGSLFGSKRRRREQRAAAAEMRAAKQAFMNIEYVNPYADLKNPYDNMENVYEDLTVNTQAADYLRQQQQQSQADIMQNLRGAAGGSGAAGLAQSIANISSAQAQQASAQIAQQEGRNQLLEAREKGRLQQLRRTGEFGVEKLKMQGEALRRKQEDARTQALFGLSIDRKMAADKARQQARSQFFAGVGQAAAGVAGLYAPGGSLYGTGNPFASTPPPNPSQGYFPSTSGYTTDAGGYNVNLPDAGGIPGLPDYLERP